MLLDEICCIFVSIIVFLSSTGQRWDETGCSNPGEEFEYSETNPMNFKPGSFGDMLFSSMTTVKYVPLPEELLNEPFAFEDNGKRPQIQLDTLRRQKFLFLIDDDGREVNCWIGGRKIVSENMYGQEIVAVKTATNLSVASIYDLYGLYVACSFIRHLYLLTEKNDRYQVRYWIVVYLIGSLSVLWPGSEDVLDSEAVQTLEHVSSMLLLKLTQMDAAQPRLKKELIPHENTLPIELLSRMLDNPTLSRSMQASVLATRCTDPTLYDLGQDHKEPFVRLLADGSYLLRWFEDRGEGDIVNIIRLTRDGYKFTLELRELSDEDTFELKNARSVAFSISDYERWFKRRGCDETVHTRRIFSEMKQRLAEVNESNIELACAWLVQLTHDASHIRDRRVMLNGFDELRDELQDIFDRVIGQA